MAFDKKYLSNASATGTNGNVFVYCNVDADGTAADDVAAMTVDAYFDDIALKVNKGTIIMLSDGAIPGLLVVTSANNVVPVTTAALPIA